MGIIKFNHIECQKKITNNNKNKKALKVATIKAFKFTK